MDKLITEFVIDIDGAKLFGEFEGQQERLAGRRDAAADGVVRVVEEGLRKNRDAESRFPGIVETPLDAGIRLAQAILSRGLGILDAQPGILVRELNALANSEVDVDVGSVGDGLTAVQK